jgi:aminoglycoside 6-adenylyltransferase
MATLQQIESAFIAWAQSNDDIRAAFVVGSQARTDHPADEWSDLDIIMFAHDPERYQQATDWIEAFAPVWVALAGHTAANDPERLVLFEGGVQVDFVFHSDAELLKIPQMLASGALPDTIVRGTRVLLDKDGALACLPPPARPPAQSPPDRATFREALDAFWFSAVYCAKQLRRGELWMFQNGSSGMLQRLLQMTEWHARTVQGWTYDTWHGGKFVAEWARSDVYDDLRRVFSRLDAVDGWQALDVRLALFGRLAREVAAPLGIVYPVDLEVQIAQCVKRLRAG